MLLCDEKIGGDIYPNPPPPNRETTPPARAAGDPTEPPVIELRVRRDDPACPSLLLAARAILR
jgi:hypothetical protein